MIQTIRLAQTPADLATAQALLGPTALEPMSRRHHLLIWLQDADGVGAALVSRDGGTARIGPLRVPPVNETNSGGLHALLKMALRSARSLATEALDRLEVEDVGFEPVMRSIGLSPNSERTRWQAPEGNLSSGFREACEHGVFGDECERLIFERGALIFQRGQPAQALYLVDRGSARVVGVDQRGEPAEVALLTHGDVLGTGVLRGRRTRAVHAVAHSLQVDVLAIDRAALERRVALGGPINPWLHAALAQRIHALSGRLLDGDAPELRRRMANVLAAFSAPLRASICAHTRCELTWLAAQSGVPESRAGQLLADLWDYVTVQRTEVEIHDPMGLRRWLVEHARD